MRKGMLTLSLALVAMLMPIGCGVTDEGSTPANGSGVTELRACEGGIAYYEWKCTYLGWRRVQVGGFSVDCHNNWEKWGKTTNCERYAITTTCGGGSPCEDDGFFRCPPPPTSTCLLVPTETR